MKGLVRSRIHVECNAYDEVPMNGELALSNATVTDTAYNPTSMAPSRWFEAPSDTSMPTTKTDKKKTTT